MDFTSLMNSHLKLRHLVMLLAIHQNGSLMRTGESLYLTQPALSRSLREAEAAVGAPLFDRTRHGMVPTAAGEAALDHARAIVGHVETLNRRVTDLSTPDTGRVSIGAHVTGANSLVPRAVGHLLAQWPRMNVKIREAPPPTLIHELESGELDMLVGRITDHESTSRLELTPLFHEPFRIVSSVDQPQAHDDPAALADLTDRSWVVPLTGTPLRDTWEQSFFDQRLPLPAQMVECGSPAPTRTLVVTYGFLAVLPESMIVGDDALVTLPPRLPGMTDKVGLMLARGRQPTEAAQRLEHSLRVQAELLDHSS